MGNWCARMRAMSGQHPEHADAADADVEARVMAALDATGEPYEIVACDPALERTVSRLQAPT